MRLPSNREASAAALEPEGAGRGGGARVPARRTDAASAGPQASDGVQVSAASPRTVGIIALSAIADDPRVRRQGDAFAAAGWGVLAIGLPGAKSAAPKWTVLDRL